MDKGIILFFDDDPDFTSQFEKLMSESGFTIKLFNSLADLRNAISQVELMLNTKALIFDLNHNPEEVGLHDFEILKDIHQKFDEYRIPIFIHSAFAEQISDFKDYGTVWKVEKSGESLGNIVQTITSLDESGFIEAFSPKGLIEQSLMQELHRSFTTQFRKGEIEKIIASIKLTNPESFKERSIAIFKRIAIKALNSELLSPVASNEDSVNPIEHFYRRISKVDCWTGDVWIKKDQSETLLVLTPRCDLANGKATKILVCEITNPTIELNGNKEKRQKQLRAHLTDNLLSKSTRYLPGTPFFAGGFVNLDSYKTIDRAVVPNDYLYKITLSDELANEIIGKFAYYFLRTGITTINTEEFDSYLNQLSDEK